MTSKSASRLILASFFALSLNITAQQISPVPEQAHYCGTEQPSQQWEAELQKLILEAKQNSAYAKSSNVVYTIPVIIHVIHANKQVGQFPNLAQGQLVSQIKVLNDDFGGIGYNSGNYHPQAFSNWALANGIQISSIDDFGRVKLANCNIQFCLATTDTNGNVLPEPGIDRINSVSKNWQDPAQINSYSAFKSYMDGTVKAQTIWDVKKYLNIWVSDVKMSAVGLLGYATFPPLSTLQGVNSSNGTTLTDGYWCYAGAFGSIDEFPSGTYYSSNTRGRTSTHEIGHYLGLRHIWGDGYCANDYCDDTPPATDKNFNAPPYPFKVSQCSGNSDGEMFMNFMDYTSDVTKYMFTEDQATRMRIAMENSPFRKFLGTHNLCTVTPIAANAAFKIPQVVCGTTAAITVTNQTTGTPVPNYTWNVSGGAFVFPNSNAQVAAINFPGAGIYTVSISADNGTVSVASRTISVFVPSVSISGYNAIECYGKEVVLTASGANYYSWYPFSVVGPTYTFNANGYASYTVIAIGDGPCTVREVLDVSVMDCTDINTLQGAQKVFNIAPNPTQSNIRVSLPNTGGATIRIIDLSGKILLEKYVEAGESSVDLNTEILSNGIYFIECRDFSQMKHSLKLIKE